MSKEKKEFICKTCEKVFTNKYNTPRTYCSRSCKNLDPDMIKKSNGKRKATWEEKYGGHPMNTLEVQEAFKDTMKKKYGAVHALQNKALLKKVQDTKEQRYGDVNYNNIEKQHETKLQRYGTLYFNERYCSIRREMKDSWEDVEILDDIQVVDLSQKVNVRCRSCKREWYVTLDNNYKPSCKVCSEHYNKVSNGHQELLNFLTNMLPGVEILVNDRKLLNGYELDLYIPSFNIAIEFNGMYYHSELFKEKSYHLQKSRQCLWSGVQLLHIHEYDWLSNKELIFSMLRARFNCITHRIYARKCEVKVISPKQKKVFLSNNHIAGDCRSSINIGLFYNGTLSAVTTFGKSRYDKSIQYELIRSCVLKDTAVVGGFSKMLSFFIKMYSPTSILSYADRDYSMGEVYIKNGFIFDKFTPPNYKYVKNNKAYSRELFQKHKLGNLLPTFDPSLTEVQNMNNNGFYRLFNSGNYRFIKLIKDRAN